MTSNFLFSSARLRPRPNCHTSLVFHCLGLAKSQNFP
jgi:hypothetical protein